MYLSIKDFADKYKIDTNTIVLMLNDLSQFTKSVDGVLMIDDRAITHIKPEQRKQPEPEPQKPQPAQAQDKGKTATAQQEQEHYELMYLRAENKRLTEELDRERQRNKELEQRLFDTMDRVFTITENSQKLTAMNQHHSEQLMIDSKENKNGWFNRLIGRFTSKKKPME